MCIHASVQVCDISDIRIQIADCVRVIALLKYVSSLDDDNMMHELH